MPTKKKNKSLSSEDKKLIEEIIRVDHAGEHGATQIYRGQLAIFKENTEFGKEIKEMADQEEIHKSTFDEYIVKENVKPTALFPFWNLAGYALGLGTALMGKKAAMACTIAVEEVIGKHYHEQAETLTEKKHSKLKKTLLKFRDDELEHKDIATTNDGEKTPGYKLMKFVIQSGCKVAIKLSEKI